MSTTSQDMGERSGKQCIELDEPQTAAVTAACNVDNRVVAVTGPAGTGKTTIMRNAVDALLKNGYRVVLAAPTGKAAKRITEATGYEAITIHRLLEYSHPGEPDPKTGKRRYDSYPKRDWMHPLEQDAFFIDEYSMATHEVHRNLFDALPRGGIVRVFGDANQLQPVERNVTLAREPSPFKSLLRRFPSYELHRPYRFGEGSGILENAQRILRGFIPQRNGDFDIQFAENPVARIKQIMQSGELDLSSDSVQLITPGHRSWIGTVKLNALIQAHYRTERDGWLELPRHTWLKSPPIRVHVGDKVIFTQNNYELDEQRGVFNGESGFVVAASEYGEVDIDFGDRIVSIPPAMLVLTREGRTATVDPRRDIDLAYALTTHKAQGSEYDRVVYVLNRSICYNATRENIYTGTTRARHRVICITDQTSLPYSVRMTEQRKMQYQANRTAS